MGNLCLSCCNKNNKYETIGEITEEITDSKKNQEKVWINKIEEYVGETKTLPECWKIVVNNMEKIIDQYSRWTLTQTLLSNLTAFINEGDRCTVKAEHVIQLTI